MFVKAAGKGRGIAELKLGPVSINMPNINQLHHMVWKFDCVGV